MRSSREPPLPRSSGGQKFSTEKVLPSGSPTASAFANENDGEGSKPCAPGLMQNPSHGGLGQAPHPGQAAHAHPCRPARRCHGWIEPCVFSALGAGAEPGRDTRLPGRDTRCPPFPVGLHRLHRLSGTRRMLWGWLGGSDHSHVDSGKRDEFLLLLLGKRQCLGCEPRKWRDALVTGGGMHAGVCGTRLGFPGKRGLRSSEGWSVQPASRQRVCATLPTAGILGDLSRRGSGWAAAVAVSPP